MNIFNIEPSEFYYSFKNIEENGCGFQYFEGSEYNGRSIQINNRQLLNFANCSYLGLEKHPALINGAINALQKYGTQNSISRAMLSNPLYKEIEFTLSEIFPGYPIVYASTSLAHSSALPLLVNEKDAIILDAHVHNSVKVASQLCKAKNVFVILSRHNNMEYVKYLIKRLKKEGYINIWYCADGIYSVQGDICDVDGLHKLLDEEKNFFAYVDDAHGIGWCGKNGCGYIISHFGLHEKMIIAGSLSKSIAVSGGFLIVPDKIIANYLKLTGSSFLFSIPLSPAILGALVESLKLHLTNEIVLYQNELSDLILYFKKKSTDYNLPIVSNNETPIQLIKVGDTEQLIALQRKLMNNGFFSSTALYPGSAKGNEGLRISITRHLKKSDIDKFLFHLKSALEH